ncbi:hypothetical protein [Rhodococcus sp. UNC363MFTsu5.1]|uniref:hypothetical protein n=1 Tax=Rhodococcus sp. UNC363MFTsu5.1 TaxID=1449069 RepID=UPI0018CC2611|nr:hypothetical protein [Rhodococcus sp. UNC363MFTsu5.1]
MTAIPPSSGGGTPFLPPVAENVPLDLLEIRTFGLRDLRALPARSPSLGLTPPTAPPTAEK